MITLELKKRSGTDTVQVSKEMLSKILDMSEAVAGRQLVKLFRTLDDTIYDKFWLSMIVNWSPQEGLPLTVMAPWLKLAERVADLAPDYEGSFELSEGQAELIYKRLGDPEFKINGLNSALATFLLDFYKAVGKHPEDLTDELMFQANVPT